MNILIISGHPNKSSFCQALAEKYQQGALEANHEVKVIRVADLSFDYNFVGQHDLEPDLIKFQDAISWCQHLVVVSPVWWLGLPSGLKALFDRGFTSGFAFKYIGRMRWLKLLKGKSVRFIYTQGAPQIVYRIFMLDSFWRSIKNGLFKYCGFSPVKRTVFGEVPISSPVQRQKWLDKVYLLGKKGV